MISSTRSNGAMEIGSGAFSAACECGRAAKWNAATGLHLNTPSQTPCDTPTVTPRCSQSPNRYQTTFPNHRIPPNLAFHHTHPRHTFPKTSKNTHPLPHTPFHIHHPDPSPQIRASDAMRSRSPHRQQIANLSTRQPNPSSRFHRAAPWPVRPRCHRLRACRPRPPSAFVPALERGPWPRVCACRPS